mgnify:CR=1 FL=1
MTEQLLSGHCYGGWGIRTLAVGESLEVGGYTATLASVAASTGTPCACAVRSTSS